MKKLLKYVNKDDGLFWISYEDLCENFRSIYVCKIFDEIGDQFQHCFIQKSQWSIKKNQAGGCMNFPNKNYNNPQFLISMKSNSKSKFCDITIVLTQNRKDITIDEGKLLFLLIYCLFVYLCLFLFNRS
jgi:hypothetical protein